MGRVTSIADKMARVREKRGETAEDQDYENSSRSRRSIPVPLDSISIEDRLRDVNHAAVDHLAESMDRQGLQSPILVRASDEGGYVLVAGAHRVEAARRLGWTQIEAFQVRDLPEDEIVLIEIDENLCRAELNAIDKAHFFAKRKEIYLRLYPETRNGGDRKSLEYRNNTRWQSLPSGRQGDHPQKTHQPSFVEDTTASTPWSARTIRLYTRIGERLDPTLREALVDTPIARRLKDLETIADMKPDKQQDVLQRLQSAPQSPQSLSALMNDPHRPSSPAKTNLDRLTALWPKTSATHRRQFLEYLWTEASGAERADFLHWTGQGEEPQS